MQRRDTAPSFTILVMILRVILAYMRGYKAQPLACKVKTGICHQHSQRGGPSVVFLAALEVF